MEVTPQLDQNLKPAAHLSGYSNIYYVSVVFNKSFIRVGVLVGRYSTVPYWEAVRKRAKFDKVTENIKFMYFIKHP